MDDQSEYTTLVAALADVPDPRKRRGRRYPWLLLLTLVSVALVSGQQHGRAIGQWVGEHADELRASLGWTGQALPSEATLRRTARALDDADLEARLRRVIPPPAPDRPRWQGLAIDGKEVRGARAHGRIVHRVSLVRHDGVVLDQVAVDTKSNEITAVPHLLAGRDLRGMVVTVDALLAHRELARQIRAQQGHYLFVIKDNEPTTPAAIATLFAEPPPGEEVVAGAVRTVDKGHGRFESRRLETSTALNGYLDWPDHGQVLRRTCLRVSTTTGEISEKVRHGITSLPFPEVDAPTLEGLWRGHWTIENRVHYPRDVTLGEDGGQAYVGSTPHVLAALRNALLTLWRAAGWASIADAVRHYQASVPRALSLIGALPFPTLT